MIALTNITSNVKTYKSGETLGNEFSQKDIERLRRLKAVEGTEQSSDDELSLDTIPPVFLTEEQLYKLSPKEKMVEYAESIGLESLTSKLSKDELVSAIRNYIEELEDGEEFAGNKEAFAGDN